jgi:hypothetical protein
MHFGEKWIQGTCRSGSDCGTTNQASKQVAGQINLMPNHSPPPGAVRLETLMPRFDSDWVRVAARWCNNGVTQGFPGHRGLPDYRGQPEVPGAICTPYSTSISGWARAAVCHGNCLGIRSHLTVGLVLEQVSGQEESTRVHKLILSRGVSETAHLLATGNHLTRFFFFFFFCFPGGRGFTPVLFEEETAFVSLVAMA